jgi:hypothetical protein
MKNLGPVLLAIMLGLTGCFEQSKGAERRTPVYRSQFIGMANLNAGTNAARLKEVWALPVSEELRNQALTSIAKAPLKLWERSLPNGVKDQPELMRPLLDDLLSAESYVELNGRDAGFDSVIAIELADNRARLWETNLWQLLSGWKLAKPIALKAPGKGWEIADRGPRVKLQRIGKWLLVGWSLGKLSRINVLADAATKNGRPVAVLTNNCAMSLRADLPALGEWVKVLQRFKLPEAEVMMIAREEYVRTEARLTLPEPIKWKFEPWNFPSNRIRDPLASFTVAQGIEPLLRSVPGFANLGLEDVPSQVCSWGIASLPFATYCTFPMPDSSNVVRKMWPKAPSFVTNFVREPLGNLAYVTNRSELVWVGLPLTIPLVAALKESSGDYLFAGLLPLVKKSNAPPAELFSQLSNRPNLIYYDWELTADRLPQANLFYQVIDIVNQRSIANTNVPTAKWSDKVAPQLGNTITEISVISPTELKLVRKSHLGLTGFEVATLLRWIDSPAFPLAFEPPPALPQRTPRRLSPPTPK